MILIHKGLSSQHKVYQRRKSKITTVYQQQEAQISKYPHIRVSFDTNYESYNED